jgi:hypothetical protein
VNAIFGTWGAPQDAAAKLAVGVAIALVIGRREIDRLSRPRFLAVTALAAALLSVGYAAVYLRGGPRIIDATTYWLEARALSEGHFVWPVIEPSASFRGRFLLFHDGLLGGLFPPGYPALLAIGFWIGAPMLIGPVLAGALVVATYDLARSLADDEHIARIAALLSLLSGALRYHTADTMSHGAAALGTILAVTFAIRGRAILAGLAAGYVLATRPVSFVPLAIVLPFLTDRRARCAIAVLPGLALLLIGQHAVTGRWLTSSQQMYYALSDGPPGCFRYGFGRGIGCVFEHGDVVSSRLASGSYGVVEAMGTTARRLRDHVRDVGHFEPLALLVPFGARTAPAKAALGLVGLFVLAYAPFYFDGDYPGGGARFFADVLPIEHALLAIAAARLHLSPPRPSPNGEGVRHGPIAVVVLSALGFACHASFEHQKLRDRDGGRPLFEPDVLARASVSTGLVFVETDHAFALGHDPEATPDRAVVVARLREDDRDRMLYEALGRPPTWWYRLDRTSNEPSLVPWAPPEHGQALRFEAEAEWPPLAQEGGFAVPTWVNGCASKSRALVLVPSGSGMATATIALPVPSGGRWEVVPRIVHGAKVPHVETGGPAEGEITIGDTTWTFDEETLCSDLAAREIDLEPPAADVRLRARGGPIALDHLLLRKK